MVVSAMEKNKTGDGGEEMLMRSDDVRSRGAVRTCPPRKERMVFGHQAREGERCGCLAQRLLEQKPRGDLSIQHGELAHGE